MSRFDQSDRARHRGDRWPGREPRARLSRGGSERRHRRHRRRTRRRPRRRARDPRAFVRLDVSDESSWAAAVRRPRSAFGALTMLVNNAGVQNPPALIDSTERATWARILDINLTGTFLGIKAAAPALRRAAGGASSTSPPPWASAARRFYAPYVASKWAVRGLTRTAAPRARPRPHPREHHPPRRDLDPLHPRTSSRRRPRQSPTSTRPSRSPIPRLGEPADVTGFSCSSRHQTRRSSRGRSTSSTVDSSSGPPFRPRPHEQSRHDRMERLRT